MPTPPDSPDGERALLDAVILRAHETPDPQTLSALYWRAATMHEQRGDEPAAAFFMTQAFVYALESGAADAEDMAAWLRDRGRQ